MPKESQGADRVRFFACVALLIAPTLFVYHDIISFSFVNWDDDINVFENPYITASSFENIKRFWSTPYADLYIPVTYSLWFFTGFLASLLPDSRDAALNPAFFHGVNLALHILNGLLVFSILKTLCDSEKERGQRISPAFIGALFFTLHPVQAEPVCWVTGMKDLLSGFFSLLSIFTCLRLKKSVSGNRNCFRLLPFTCFVMALLSKPSAVTLPVAILVIEWLFFKRDFFQTLFRLTPWFLFSLITVVVSQISQKSKISGVFNIWKQAAAGLEAAGFYVIKLALPFKLSADYGLSIANVLESNGYRMFLMLLLPALIFVLLRKKEFIMPVLLFFIFLLPSLGFVPFAFQSISIVADRYMYMSLFGISTGIAFWLKKSPDRLALIPVSVALTCFALMSAFSSKRWETPFELFTRTILTNPNSYISYNNLGIYFFKLKNYQEAAYYFKEALKVKPGFLLSSFNLGNSLANLNQLDDSKRHFKNVLEVDPEHLLANYNLGIVYIRSGMYDDAIRQLNKVVSIDNSYAPAYFDLGKLMAAQQKYDEAANMYKLALEADKSFTEAYVKLGTIYFNKGNHTKASFFYKKALSLDPANFDLKQKLNTIRQKDSF